MPTVRPGDLALTVLLICQDAPPLEREGRAMEFGAQDKAGILHAGIAEGERTVRFALGIVARPAADGGDVLPARAAGMWAVFLRRGPWGHIHATWPEREQAHMRIERLDELPGLFGLDERPTPGA